MPFARIGKLIVASDAAEVRASLPPSSAQAARQRRGELDRYWTQRRPARWSLRCGWHSALHSPQTGIVDSHALMLAYLGDAWRRRVRMLALHAPL